jgi:hypothetical protein
VIQILPPGSIETRRRKREEIAESGQNRILVLLGRKKTLTEAHTGTLVR